jgi:hypothetical protein
MIRLKVQWTFVELKQKFRFGIVSCTRCVSIAVTNDESESAMLMASWRFRFATPEQVVSSPCSLTSSHCSTAPHDMPPSPLSHAPSHLRGIRPFDTSDNSSGDHGDVSCAS